MNHKSSFKCLSNIENVFLLLLWITWIVIINSGSENGIGYFQQPDNELLLPLINGSIFNALVFFMCVGYLIPHCLKNKKYKLFGLYLIALMLGYLLFKTSAEFLIIYFSMPELIHVTLYELMIENLYTFFIFLMMGVFYSIIRDWIKDSFGKIEDKYITVKVANQMQRIKVEDILYIKSEGNYVLFIVDDKQIISYMTMKQVNLMLLNRGFVQVHRTYIVAVSHIEVSGKNTIQIKGSNIPIGGTFKKNLKGVL